jgi:hypothetical protein
VDDVDGEPCAEFLYLGEELRKAGRIDEAIEHYLLYCELVARPRILGGKTGPGYRASAVRRQVLALRPDRRDVRRALAEDYVSLGLLDDARRELERVAEQAAADGDVASRMEALARMDSVESGAWPHA